MKKKRISAFLFLYFIIALSMVFSVRSNYSNRNYCGSVAMAQELDPVVVSCDSDWGYCWDLAYENGFWGFGSYFYCKWTGRPVDRCTASMVAFLNLPSMGDQQP
jgi:hypothetical protein